MKYDIEYEDGSKETNYAPEISNKPVSPEFKRSALDIIMYGSLEDFEKLVNEVNGTTK